MAYKLIFVILLYSPSCFGQETAKKPFGLRVKLPRFVYHTLWSLHGVPFLLLNAKQGIEPRSSFLVTDTRSLIGRTLCFFVRKVEKIHVQIIKKTIGQLLLVMHNLTQI